MERLIMPTVSIRNISYRVFVPAYMESELISKKWQSELTGEAEKRIWFCSEPNTDDGSFGLIVDLRFEIVNFILLRYGQVALNAAFGIEKLNLCSCLDEAIRDL